jgi:hypothetical protein
MAGQEPNLADRRPRLGDLGAGKQSSRQLHADIKLLATDVHAAKPRGSDLCP